MEDSLLKGIRDKFLKEGWRFSEEVVDDLFHLHCQRDYSKLEEKLRKVVEDYGNNEDLQV